VRSRSNSLLKVRIILAALLASFAIGSLGVQTVQTAIIEVKSSTDATVLAARFGLTLLDSIPELNRYLVSGDAASLGSLRQGVDIRSIELNFQAEISETAMLNESTVALLDPATVALLDENDKSWDGEHLIRASMLTQPALRRIGFEGANVDSGDPVTVAVIDTGVDPFHEMLMGRTLPGLNLIDERRSTDELFDLDPTTAAMLLKAAGQSTSNRPSLGVLNPSTVALLDPSVVTLLNRVPSLYFGHGTLVSSLIHVVAPTATILPVKVFDASGHGTSFRIAKAIIYATGAGAEVINMSFSLETFSPLVDEALDYAAQRKVVLVASIGNRNSKVDKKYANYPASYPKVVSVAATNSNDRKALFSNYGPATDVSAPGEALMSAYPGGLYAVWSGTSGAAALVSGEAALLLSRKAQKADDATKRIIDRVDPIHDQYDLGKGRINLHSALH
jgi:subtilisin family serine protease